MPSDTYILTISDAGVSVPAANSVTNASVASNAAISFSKLASLTSGNVLVGNSSNVPTSVAVTGDVTISNTGVTSIASGSIVNADINDSAAIAHSKLASVTSGNILVGNSGNVPTSVAVSGDATLSNSGSLTIANDAVTFAKMQPVSGFSIVGKPTADTGDITEIGSSAFMLQPTTGFLRQSDASSARSTLGLGTLSTLDTLTAATGGTGITSYAVGDLLYASDTTTLSKLADVATGSVLLSGGVNTAPSYGKVGLTTHVSGILPVANGGTGSATGLDLTTSAATGILPVSKGGTGYGSDGIGTLTFDTTPDTGTALTEGQLRWNSTDKTLDLKMAGSSVTQQIGEEVLMRVHASGSVTNGQVVYISGSNAGLPAISAASNDADTAKKTLGIATESITSGSDGYITLMGLVRDLNLSAYTAGQELWLSTAGGITGTEPSYPAHKVRVGYVVNATDGTGSLYFAPKFYENGTVNGTGKIGYLTGSGGSETQQTNKSTGVTLNKTNGQITMNNASLAGNTAVSFTLTNSKIEAGDVLVLNHISGGTLGTYAMNARSASGSATISLSNLTNGNLAEAVVIAFAVIKAVTA